MLRPWLGSGSVRAICARLSRPILPSRIAPFSSAPRRYLQADHVPLRKQLKQDAKALRSHKKQRKESEEASRQEWELTVGVEIHAQLDTEAKLFSRQCVSTPIALQASHGLNRSPNLDKRDPQFQCRFVRPGIPGQPTGWCYVQRVKDHNLYETGIPNRNPPPCPTCRYCSEL